jgi:diguanylate cyclase (GGDEF)-like protein
MTMKRAIRILSIALLIASVIFVSVFVDKSNLWQQDLVVENRRGCNLVKTGWSVNTNKTIDQNASISITKIFHVDEVRKMRDNQTQRKKTFRSENNETSIDWPVLLFLTHNQNVLVYEDSGTGSKLIYSFGNNGTQYVGSESGNAIHCVTLQDVGQKDVAVTIKLFPSYDSPNLKFEDLLYGNSKASVPDFYFGWRTMCLVSYLKSTIYQTIPILLIYAVGLLAVFAFLAIYIMRKIKAKQYLYWGLFALSCATGFLFESKIGLLLFENSFMLYFLSTVIIALYPRLFLIYMQERTILMYNESIAKIFKIIAPLNVLVVCASSFITAIPFIFVRYYVGIVFVLFILFMTISILRNTFSLDGKLSLFDGSIVFAALCILIDLVLVNFKHPNVDIFFFSRIGMLVFFTVCGVLTTNEFYDGEILKARSGTLEKVAYSDLLTGCKNTAALWRDNKQLQLEQKNFAMALVKISNIMTINKTEGYASGDTAVRTVAQILQTTFSKNTVYRLNGTKFCILLQNEEIDDFATKMDTVKQAIEVTNEQNDALPVQIVGSAGLYNPAQDLDFDGIYIRLLEDLRRQAHT